MRVRALAAISLVAIGAVSACSRSTHGSGGPTSRIASAATTTTAPRVPFRRCATAANGALGAQRINRAGPIGFVDGWARSQLPIRRRGTRIRPTKILVVVADGTTVTVTVPTAETDALRLFYRQPTPSSIDGFYDMAAGDPTMTFEGCPRAHGAAGSDAVTQFPGYFLVKQPGCYRVDIRNRGSTRALHANLSLGRPC